VDRWLWAVRLTKTRSDAAAACRGGHVRVNDQPAKPATPVRAGDTVRTRVYDIARTVEVSAIIEKRVGAPVAVTCYVDHTPPPPPPAERVAPVAARERGAGRPTKRDRRRLEAFQRAATIDGVEHEVEPDPDAGPVFRPDPGP
jgi:ribosome-associated heat shock protein Hsp15